MSIKKLLNEALELSQKRSVKLDNVGMASVKLEWNPYQAKWEAEANWSDNFKIRSTGFATQEETIQNLLHKLSIFNEQILYNDPEFNKITEDCKPFVDFQPSEAWLKTRNQYIDSSWVNNEGHPYGKCCRRNK